MNFTSEFGLAILLDWRVIATILPSNGWHTVNKVVLKMITALFLTVKWLDQC